MRTHSIRAVLLIAFFASSVFAQTQSASTEIPLSRCDVLPVADVNVSGTTLRFLVDTGATSMLNAQSVPPGHSKQIEIASWTGVTTTRGRQVFVPKLTLGGRTLTDLKMEAVDLSPIAKACGGRIDGILGVDLLQKFGVTIDLERNVARLGAVRAPGAGAAPAEIDEHDSQIISEMDAAMHPCSEAFDNADADVLTKCFDPDFVWSTPSGEYHGRTEAHAYLTNHVFGPPPHGHFNMKINDQRAIGSVVWTLYDFSIDTPANQHSGRGMMICRKSEGRWSILSMHDVVTPPSSAPPAAAAAR